MKSLGLGITYEEEASALEVIFNVMRSINPRFTDLLTYTTKQKNLREGLHVFTELKSIRKLKKNSTRLNIVN